MKAAFLLLALAVAGCAQDMPLPADDAPGGDWPPPTGTLFATCSGVRTGDTCSAAGWCNDCYVMIGCYCDGDHYECHDAASVCDFGEGAACPREGTPACHTPPAPAYCTCTAGAVECEYVCPLAECPDYDPGSSSCTCAAGDGNCG